MYRVMQQATASKRLTMFLFNGSVKRFIRFQCLSKYGFTMQAHAVIYDRFTKSFHLMCVQFHLGEVKHQSSHADQRTSSNFNIEYSV